MLPTLRPGDEFVATDSRPARRGEVVALVHPQRPDFWLVKRLTAVAGDISPAGPLGVGEAWVSSDRQGVDSDRFGPVPADRLMPMVSRLDPQTFREGLQLLSSEDRSLARILEVHGEPGFWWRPPGFATLTLLIIEQQVSLESAAAVYRRVAGALPITPEAMAELSPVTLGELGVTRQKAGYVIGLAQSIQSSEVDLDEISRLDPDLAHRALTSIRGIGPWTADAYLLSALGHPDVFPVGDRALQVGAGETLGMETVPDQAELELLSEAWRPLRAVAARLIWHGYLSARGRMEPVHDIGGYPARRVET